MPMFIPTAIALMIPGAALLAQSHSPSQSPPVPEAILDLRTPAGVAAIAGSWRFTDAHIVSTDFPAAGIDRKPSGPLQRTHDIHPRVGTSDFGTAPWQSIAPDDLESRRSAGLLAFGWYHLDLTIPEHIGEYATTGSEVVLELVIDDYAEIWIDGALPQTLGQSGGQLVAGWNTPNRVVLSRSAKPGTKTELAIFAANAPLSAPPKNYVWIRSATLEFHMPGRGGANPPTRVPTEITRLDPALDAIITPGTQAERLASGFVFTEGPVWVPRRDASTSISAANSAPYYGGGGSGGYLLFSDPNQNVIHRFDPASGGVSIYRTKSGYSGIGALEGWGGKIGEYHQPGSNGLALDPQHGRLTICEHGNRRVSRLEPNGTLTVLADRFEGKRLNSPNDLVYRSDGALYFTDPPFGLPKVFGDPRKELDFSGVYCLHEGQLLLASKELKAPNGLAFSPDEQFLYVDNWEEQRKVVLRFGVESDGRLGPPTTFFDMTSRTGEICLDGLKVDRRGNVLVTGPGGLWILSPAGQHLGTIALPELPANMAFDADATSLFICARTGLYRLPLASPMPGTP